jgi:hypothetical protein
MLNKRFQMSLWTRTYTLDRLPGQQTATQPEIDTKVDDDLEKGPLDSNESDDMAKGTSPRAVDEEIQKQGTILDPVAPAGPPFGDDVVQSRVKG